MPEEIPPTTTPLDPSKNNEDVARKLVDQDTSLKPSSAEELKDAGTALDALMKAKDTPVPPVEDKPEDKGQTPPVESKPGDEPPPKPKPVEAPVVPVEDPAKKRAEELFKDSPSLPQGASPKSAEAFAAVKIKAAQEISAREQKLAEAEKKNKELEDKLKTPVPEALTKELESLREFRARLDIEADPKFKEFDTAISQTREFIYAQLKGNPAVTDETIESIKKYGGPENVNLDKLFASLKDPALQRIVDSAITDIEKAKFNKQEAIKSAKANIASYVSERQKEWEQSASSFANQTRAHLTQYSSKLEWLKPKMVPDGADASAKKAVESHNEFVAATNKSLEEAISDDSAEMRAILITGMAQLLYTQRIQEATSAENKSLKAEVAKLTEMVNKFKTGSTTRLRENNTAPGSGSIPAAKPADMLNVRPADALDEIAKQVAEARAAKAAAGA